MNIVTTLTTQPDPASVTINPALRPSLMFDIDGTLGFLFPVVVAAVNAHFGLDLVASEITTYNLSGILQPDQAAWVEEQFANPNLYTNCAPDFRGIGAVQALHKADYEIVIATDRPEGLEDITEKWLKRWDVPYDQLMVGWGKKEAWCAKHGPKDPAVLFDDSPAKAMTIPRPGMRLFVPLRSYTPAVDFNRANVVVFREWSEALVALGVPPTVLLPR